MNGTTDVVKGRIKEAAGVLIGDDKLRAKGQTDQTVGHIKQAAEKIVDKARDLVEKAGKNMRK